MDIYEDKPFEGMVKLHEYTNSLAGVSGMYADRLATGFKAWRAEYGMDNKYRIFRFKDEPCKEYWSVLINELRNTLGKEFRLIDISANSAVIFYGVHPAAYFQVYGTVGDRTISITGGEHIIQDIQHVCKNLFDKNVITFYNTYYNTQRDEINTSSMTIDCVEANKIAPIAHYPYLDKDPEQFANDFMKSRSNVVLLVGPPGTGKSTYLRAVSNAFYNVERDIYIMNSDQVLNSANLDEFIKATAKGSIFIIEDADRLVGKRSDGNAQMSMLLNQIDGIVVSDKKFIISTNLASINKVDEALIRPGRCYSVLNFRKLKHTEANLIYKQHYNTNDDLPDNGDLSLAEVLNYNTDVEQKKRVTTFGFNQ